MTRYDVIVVGGRVAGSATAMLLARSGERVLLLERNTFPSAPVSVPVIFANALSILDKLGVRDALEERATKLRVGGARLGDIQLLAPVQPLNGIDYHLGLRREVLDTILIDQAARESGVDVRVGFSVSGLIKDGAGVIGVRGRQSGGAEELIHADLVVGADGAHSIVAREVEPKQYRTRRGQNCVYYAYYRNFGDRGQPMSYSYRGEGYAVLTFEADDGLTALSLGVQPRKFASFERDAVGEFERRWRAIPELAELGRDAVRVGPVKGHGPRDSYYRQPYGDGWALVGDAGYLKDPCTGQGIYDALRSAELLVESWRAWRGGEDWNKAMRRYQRTRDRETWMMYDLTFQSSKIPKQAKLNPIERMIFGSIAKDQEYVKQLAGIYNGASSVWQYTGPIGGLRMAARLGLRPLALKWAVRQRPTLQTA